MSKTILITGVAGSGKSTVASELQKRGFKTYDFEELEGFCAFYDTKTGEKLGEYSGNDNLEKAENRDWICDVGKMRELVSKKGEGDSYYCGIVSNIEDLAPLFDKVMLLVATSDNIRKRLSSRDSNNFGSSKEVQDWVIDWKDEWEEKMMNKGAIKIDANDEIKSVVDEILERS